jgi:RDD family
MAIGPREASLGRRLEALLLTPLLLIVTLGIGWLLWSIFEWRHGRTPSYRLLGLRVVRRSNGEAIGLGRSFARSGLCCPVLVVPTIVIGGIVGVCFALGASPPDGLLSRPRAAPWDRLTSTRVLDERADSETEEVTDADTDAVIADLIDRADMKDLNGPRRNGHAGPSVHAADGPSSMSEPDQRRSVRPDTAWTSGYALVAASGYSHWQIMN